MEKALAEEASAIVKSCDPAILARAVHYYYPGNQVLHLPLKGSTE